MKKNVIILFAALLGLSWFSAVSEAVNNPRELEAHLERAEELEAKGIYVDAVTEYESALEYEPDDPVIYEKMAKANLNSGNSREFVSICKETAENYQDDTEALDMLMNYYTENDYEEDAVQYLQDFTEQYPENENAQKWFLELKGSYTELYCRYEEISEIVNGFMVVKDDELYGIADASGSEVIPCEYKAARPFSGDGFALVQKEDGAWIYIDEDGQTRKVPDEEYSDFGMLNEERTTASREGKYGYLDENMEPVGNFEWEKLTGFTENTGAGLADGKWVLVGDDCEAKEDGTYEDVIADDNGFCSNQKRIFVKTDGVYHIVNAKGKEVGELAFDDAKAFTPDGFAAVCSDGKWGFVNADGELVIDYQYDDAESFQNGYAPVCVEDQWGYIDESGNMVIEPRFTLATHFSEEGTAAVKELIQGEEVWKLIQLNLFQ